MKTLLAVFLTLFTLTAIAGVNGFSSTTNLGIFDSIKCSTGLTCTKVGSKFNMVSSPNLVGPLVQESGAVYANPTSYDITHATSGDTTLTVKGGVTTRSAALQLFSNNGAAAINKFSIVNSTDNTVRMYANSNIQALAISPTSADISTSSSLNINGAYGIGSAVTSFASGDATPSVTGKSFFSTFTGNTTTITGFTGELFVGKKWIVLSRGPVTYNVAGQISCGTTAIVTASGDLTSFVYDGVKAICETRMSTAKNNN